MTDTFLPSIRKQLLYYKSLGERAIDQLSDDFMAWQPDAESNSIVMIVKHMRGNMVSRFSDFLTSDGEKPDRNRDEEFENEPLSKVKVFAMWQQGWNVVLNTLDSLTPDDLTKPVTIRGEAHQAWEAIARQLAHYAYHVGQIVYIAKFIRSSDWKTLTIPRGGSQAFNEQMQKKE